MRKLAVSFATAWLATGCGGTGSTSPAAVSAFPVSAESVQGAPATPGRGIQMPPPDLIAVPQPDGTWAPPVSAEPASP